MTTVRSDSASTVSCHVAFMLMSSINLAWLFLDATKLGKHIRIMGLIPVAETGPDQIGIRGPRRAFQHEVLAVEKIRRVFLILGHIRSKARKGVKFALGPLPAVADQFAHAPEIRALGIKTYRYRRPVSKPDVSVRGPREIISAGRTVLCRIGVSGTLKLGLGWKPRAAPISKRPGFGQADVNRP